MANTTMRAVRCEDKIWDNAKLAATANGTSVSAAVVNYLRTLVVSPPIGLKDRSDGKREAVRRTPGATPMRTFRCDDSTWELAAAVAARFNTSITDLVVSYLRTLKYDPDSPAPTPTKRIQRPDPPVVKLATTMPKPQRKKVIKPSVKVDPATCLHKSTKTIKFGTFCTECGSKLENKEALV